MKHGMLKSLACCAGLAVASPALAGKTGYEESAYAYDSYELNESPSREAGMSFKPTQVNYELSGPMRFTRGGGHMTAQNIPFFAALIAPNYANKATFGLDFFSRYTRFSAKNNDVFHSNNLGMFGLNLSGSYALGQGEQATRLFAGVSGMLATDFDAVTWDAMQWGARAGVSYQFSEKLSMQFAIVYTPQLTQSPLLPYVLFKYQIDSDWCLQMDPFRLRLMNVSNSAFTWGGFLGYSAGSWNVKEDGRHLRFSTFSGLAGVQTNFLFAGANGKGPTLTTELGFSFANSANYYTSNGKHKVDSRSANPGFYMQAGMKFEF